MHRIGILCFAILVTMCTVAPAFAIELDEIVGVWNNDGSSENLEIRRDGEVLDDRLGQGRIADGIVDKAGNLVIVYQNNDHCYYHATLVDDDHLRLANRSGPQPSALCLLGQFTKVRARAAKVLAGFDLVNSVIKKTFSFGLGERHLGVNGVKGEWGHFACDCITGDFWHYTYSWSRNRNVTLTFLANKSNIIEGITIEDSDRTDIGNSALLTLYGSLRRQWGDLNAPDVKYASDGFGRDRLQVFQGVRYHYQRFTGGSREGIFIAVDH